MMVRSALTVQEKAEIWREYQAGASLRSISRTLGRTMGTLRILVASTGGRPPLVPRRSALRLAPAEREEISRGVVAGDSCRMIGGRIRRAVSTVWSRPGSAGKALTAQAPRHGGGAGRLSGATPEIGRARAGHVHDRPAPLMALPPDEVQRLDGADDGTDPPPGPVPSGTAVRDWQTRIGQRSHALGRMT
jgi:hypothetical protein